MSLEPEMTDPAPGREHMIYSPTAILEIFNKLIVSKTERKLIYVRGIFEKNEDRPYSGYFYNRLKDEFSDQSIKLKTPEKYHELLRNNQVVEFSGILKRSIHKKGYIDIYLNMERLIDHSDDIRLKKESAKLKLLSEKAQAGKKDMDGLIRSKIFRNEPIIIRVIMGRNGIVDEDIRKAIGMNPTLYNIDYRKVSIDSSSQIINALAELDKTGADIICVTRGGGDLEIFENEDICMQLLITNAMIASAIGHAADISLFDLMADKSFTTPTDFGYYLKSMYEKTVLEIESAKRDMSENIHNVHTIQLRKMQQSITELEEKDFHKNKLLRENSAMLEIYDGRLKSSVRNNKLLIAAAMLLSGILIWLKFS